MSRTIKFELSDVSEGVMPPYLMPGAKTREESLHEALCRAIHEQNPEALKWLTANVVNIE